MNFIWKYLNGFLMLNECSLKKNWTSSMRQVLNGRIWLNWIRCYNKLGRLFDISVDVWWITTLNVFKKKVLIELLTWLLFFSFWFTHTKVTMDSDVPEIVKSLNNFTIFLQAAFLISFIFWFSGLLFIPAISRKRYVREKLFNQILNELCGRQCEKQNATELNTEYSDKFTASKDFQNDNNQPVRIHISFE